MNIKIWMLIHNHTNNNNNNSRISIPPSVVTSEAVKNITRNLHTTEIKSAVYLMQLAVHLMNAKKPSTETVTL